MYDVSFQIAVHISWTLAQVALVTTTTSDSRKNSVIDPVSIYYSIIYGLRKLANPRATFTRQLFFKIIVFFNYIRDSRSKDIFAHIHRVISFTYFASAITMFVKISCTVFGKSMAV